MYADLAAGLILIVYRTIRRVFLIMMVKKTRSETVTYYRRKRIKKTDV